MKTRSILARLHPPTLVLAALAALTLGSCAYYNTFYMARKYYARATLGLPYRVEKTDSPDATSLNKSIDFSKKLLANYPRSKWVDDAYLLWAKAFLAKNDPLQTITMLEDFPIRFPNSALAAEVTFYRAVALRHARRYAEALQAFDDYLQAAPRGELRPYAHLERARTLRSLDRPADAAAAAGEVVARWPKSPLAVTARIARADANLVRGAYEEARADFHLLGQRSRTDDERLEYLLRESECLEAARRFDEALGLLREALGHEKPPAIPDTTGGRPLVITQGAGFDRYGRLLIRIGTIQLMSGATQPALESYRRVVNAYYRTNVAAEAQYRIGYAHEIGFDDFEAARVEYARVREVSASSPFVSQAAQRITALEQLARFRTAGGDSVEKRAQGGFLLAEQYLFQLDKPERALAEYARVAEENRGNAWGGKALNAQAWVLRQKFNRSAEAESLHWRVVREYPATEAQLAARDYLEALGHHVPPELIQLPPPPEPKRDSLPAAAPEPAPPSSRLSPIPSGAPPLGNPFGATASDSVVRAAAARSVFGSPDPSRYPPPPVVAAAESHAAGAPAAADTTGVADTLIARGPAPPAPGAPPIAAAGTPPPPVAAAGTLPPVAAAEAPVVAAAEAPPAATPRAAAPPADTTARPPAPDSAAVRLPLPPLELSPVRPGITFPSGRPRRFGMPEPAYASATGAAPRADAPIVVGAPPAGGTGPATGLAGGAASDSLSGALLRAPATAGSDSLGARRDSLPRPSRGFVPPGDHFQ